MDVGLRERSGAIRYHTKHKLKNLIRRQIIMVDFQVLSIVIALAVFVIFV